MLSVIGTGKLPHVRAFQTRAQQHGVSFHLEHGLRLLGLVYNKRVFIVALEEHREVAHHSAHAAKKWHLVRQSSEHDGGGNQTDIFKTRHDVTPTRKLKTSETARWQQSTGIEKKIPPARFAVTRESPKAGTIALLTVLSYCC